MEPVDYLKILRAHWKVVAALVLIAVVVVFIVSPKQAPEAYSADHVLVLELPDEDGGGATANVSVDAEYRITSGEIPIRAAEILGNADDQDDLADRGGELAERVEALGDVELSLLTITATAPNQDEAIAIANAFGQALVEFTDERQALLREQADQEAAAEIDEVEARIGEIQTQLSQVPPPPDEALLRGELSRLEAQLVSASEAVEAAGGGPAYVTVQEAVTASREASRVSSRGQRVALAAVVAALLGFGVAIVLDRNDSRLRTKDQVERQFGLPVLAEVPLLGWRQRRKAAVVAFRRDPGVAEAYRGLRTSLLLFRGAAATGVQSNGNGRAAQGIGTVAQATAVERQLVVVTSAESGDGKSTTVANLALAHAETGQSVLIVNWDLWRPMLPSAFNAVEGPGVVDYLGDPDALLVRFVQDTSVPGVRIITSGIGGHHPGARIETVRRLLDEARTLADVVIVDTAPILSASVSRELATLADAVVLVCRAGRSTGVAAGRVSELLGRIGAGTLGVVLIGVSSFGDYYGHRYTRWPQTVGAGRGAAGEGRHMAPDGPPLPSSEAAGSLAPTAAQYRAAIPKAPESEEPAT